MHVVYVGHRPIILYESPEATVLDPDLQRWIGTREDAEEATKAILDEQVQKIREAGGQIAGTHLMLGDPDAEIVGLAERLSAGLIVMGSRGRGRLRRALLGSVADSVIRHAHCSVVVLRSQKQRSAENEENFLT